MQTEKAIALNDFLNNAANLLLSNVEDGVLVPEMKINDITELTEENFEKHYTEFEQELVMNITEYRDYTIIFNYINHYLNDIYVWRGFGSNFIKSVFVLNSNVNELLKAKQLVENYKLKITYLLSDDVFRGELSRLIDKVLYPEEIAAKKEEFVADSKYIFDEIVQEISNEKLSTIKAIGLLNERIYDFKQWQTINDTVYEYNSWGKVSETKHPKSKKYYPNLEELCNLEIKKLRNKLELEKAELTNKAIEKNKVVIQTNQTPPFKWNSNDTDFLELFAALYQNESIVRADGKPLTRKEMLDYFQSILGLEIKDVEGKLTKATNRKLNMTPFIDSIKTAFETYAKEKENKLESRR